MTYVGAANGHVNNARALGSVAVGWLHASISPICKEMEDLHIANGIDSSIL